MNLKDGFLGLIIILMSSNLYAQVTTASVPVTQQDPRIHVNLQYQYSDDNVANSLSQDYRIKVRNNTNYKLQVYIEYYADLVCGTRKVHQLGPLDDGFILGASEVVDRSWNADGINSYQRVLGSACPKDSWKKLSADKDGNQMYSIIAGMGYRIVKIINLTEKERKEAATVAQNQRDSGGQQDVSQSASYQNKPPVKQSASNTTSTTPASTGANSHSGDLIPSSKFKNNLSNVQVGEYFEDGNGNYYQKVAGGAKKVSAEAYKKSEADKFEAKRLAQERADQRQRESLNTLTNDLTGLGGTLLSNMSATREARWERESTTIRSAQNALDQNMNLAERGDAEALKKVSRAYRSLAYINDEHKSGFKIGHSKEQEEFLARVYSNTGSDAAKSLLVDFYKSRQNLVMNKYNKSVRGAILGPIIGGGMIFGAIKLSNYIEEHNSGAGGTVAMIVGVGLGSWVAIEGLVDAGKLIGGGRKSKEYKDADSKIKGLDKKIAYKIYPSYNLGYRATGLNVSLSF